MIQNPYEIMNIKKITTSLPNSENGTLLNSWKNHQV